VDNELIISFLQLGYAYDLRINNESFTHLTELDKQRREFYVCKKDKVEIVKESIEFVESEEPKGSSDAREDRETIEVNEEIPSISSSQPQIFQFFNPPTSIKENFKCENFMNTSRKLEDLYNQNFNKVQKSGTSLLNIEEKSSAVFPLCDPNSNETKENVFKKSNSIVVESSESQVSSINALFDQLDFSQNSSKPPSKVDEVKRLYQRTFSDSSLTQSGAGQKMFEINDTKTREDNFYSGFLMNPNGKNMNNWQFNKDVFQYSNCETPEQKANHRVSSLSLNSQSTTNEDEPNRGSSSTISMKYPDLSNIDHKKLAFKSSNSLIEFSPLDKVTKAPDTPNTNPKQQSFNDIMAELFN
jgi:hypothetical protein